MEAKSKTFGNRGQCEIHVLIWQQRNGGFVSVLMLHPSLVSTRTE